MPDLTKEPMSMIQTFFEYPSDKANEVSELINKLEEISKMALFYRDDAGTVSFVINDENGAVGTNGSYTIAFIKGKQEIKSLIEGLQRDLGK